MSEIQSPLQFPVEIIENVISDAWVLPLSANERITLITSSLLVNKTWMTLFTRVSSKDVYIPCASYAQQFLRMLREESPIYEKHLRAIPDQFCRSLTFQVSNHNTSIRLFSNKYPMGDAITNTLYAIQTLSYLPNLRRVSIQYNNWGFDDLLYHYRLIVFPPQVTEFELKYTYSHSIPPALIKTLRSDYLPRECLRWSMPSVRHLAILGAGESFVMHIMSTFPNVETLVTDSPLHCDFMLPTIESGFDQLPYES